jgi:hypothetical protein
MVTSGFSLNALQEMDEPVRVMDRSSPSGGRDQGILNQGQQARAGGMIWRDYIPLSEAGQYGVQKT